jgi:hypothetical protein
LQLRTWWINKKPRIDLEIDTLWRHFHLNETTRLYKITLFHSLFIYKKRSLFWTALCIFTTRFHSFTNENISSVCDSFFIGNFITDDITDGNSPSAFLSSVKKKHWRWFYRRKLHSKKKSSRLKYTDGFIPSVSVCNIDRLFSLINASVIVKYRQIYSVGSSSVIVKCAPSYCEMSTELFRWYIRR